MADEEVKVHVRSEADNRALDATEAKIKELYRTAAVYESKGIDTAAKSVRSEAASFEKDVARYKREQHAAEKDITRERREQAAINHAEETQRQTFGRLAFGRVGGVGGGGVIGGAAIFAIEEIMTDRMERQGIALRDQAARTMNARGLGIMAGVRGTAGQSKAEEYSIDQRMAEREANRPAFDQEQDKKKMQSAWGLAKDGAVAGAIIGSFIPVIGTAVGAAIGAAAGGIAGAIHGGAEGARSKTERDAAQKRDAEQIDKQKDLTRDKFENEEGGLGLDALRQRAKRTQSGQRKAFMDDYLAKALQTKRQFAAEGATPEQQNEAARLEMTNSLRDRQATAGAGLVTARSGAGDIAAAARWGSHTTPMESEAVKRLDKIVGKMDDAHKASQMKDQSVPPSGRH